MAAPIPRLAPVTNATLRSCVMQFSLQPLKWHLRHPPDDCYCQSGMLFLCEVSVLQGSPIRSLDHIQQCTEYPGLAGTAWCLSIAQTDTIEQSKPDAIEQHQLLQLRPHFVLQECLVAQWQFVPKLVQTVLQLVSSVNSAMALTPEAQWLWLNFLWRVR